MKPKYFAKQVLSSVGHIYITFDKICIIVATGNTRVQQWFMINIAHTYDQTNFIWKNIFFENLLLMYLKLNKYISNSSISKLFDTFILHPYDGS